MPCASCAETMCGPSARASRAMLSTDPDFTIVRLKSKTNTFTRCPISIRILEEHRNSLPAANAGGGDSIAQFRATEFTRKRKSEPDAGCRQRMPNRNRAAIHIEFVAVDPQLALHSDELRGKRFVDLESIDLT